MKDRIRYSEAFKLKVMEEFRDGKWKSVKEVAMAYGVAEMSVYYWMRKLGFEHLKGRLIYVKTKSEIDEIKRLKEENRQLKLQLADRVLDHEIDKATLKIACERLGMPVDELKKRTVSRRTRGRRCREEIQEKDQREAGRHAGLVLREPEGPLTHGDLRGPSSAVRARGTRHQSRLRHGEAVDRPRTQVREGGFLNGPRPPRGTFFRGTGCLFRN